MADKTELELRTEALSVYGFACVCCGQGVAEYLNVIPIRIGSDGKQLMRAGDAPMTYRSWMRLESKGFPDGYVVYCTNCVASHPLGTCPYMG